MRWWWINSFHSTNQTKKWGVIRWWTSSFLKSNTLLVSTNMRNMVNPPNLRDEFMMHHIILEFLKPNTRLTLFYSWAKSHGGRILNWLLEFIQITNALQLQITKPWLKQKTKQILSSSTTRSYSSGYLLLKMCRNLH
jgi:hypothetical protein